MSLDLRALAREEFCYLTTTGRITGKPHEIEIWFGLDSETLYMLSGGGDRSDWVKNLRQDPEVEIRITGRTFGKPELVVPTDRPAGIGVELAFLLA